MTEEKGTKEKATQGYAQVSDIPGAVEKLKSELGIITIQCPHCDEKMYYGTKEKAK